MRSSRLNPDAGGVSRTRQAADRGVRGDREAVRATFQVLATNPGGHSSLPVPDNAIYHVADALAALAEMARSRSS